MASTLVGVTWDGEEYSLTARDVCLYALASGVGRQPAYASSDELRFVFEQHSRFAPLPTFATTFPFLGVPPNSQPLAAALAARGLRFSIEALLHAEQSLTLLAPFPLGKVLRNFSQITQVVDKGNGLLVTTETVTRAGNLAICSNLQSVFIRGLGSGAVARGALSSPRPAGEPGREPDGILIERLENNAALLFRLCGDLNPLHVSPAVAAQGGFRAPIVHGLCTLAWVVRAIVLRLLDGSAERVCRVTVRFSGVVYMGESLETKMWWTSPSKIAFSTNAEGRPALSSGLVELHAAAAL